MTAPENTLTQVMPGAFTPPGERNDTHLVGQRCSKCGARFFPGARASCIACYSPDLEPAQLTRLGKVDAFTVARQAPRGYHGPVPFAVGSVVLDDGASVICQLIGKEPEAWQCGERVASYAFLLPRDAEKRSEVLCYGFAPATPEDLAEAEQSSPARIES
jgi:uncharacterized OB-fold protein